MNKTAIFLIVISTLSLLSPSATRAAHLNKTAIIDQAEVAYNGITAAEIQQYINASGSQLANYKIPEFFEVYYPIGMGQWDKVTVRQEKAEENEIYYGKTVAELIFEIATTDKPKRQVPSPGKINPLIALATLDKESGPITGDAKNNILERDARMSWIAGYGFDDRMSLCIQEGKCDYDKNGTFDENDKLEMRKRANWFGGPGIQITAMVAALKRWNANPTPPSYTCEERTWQRVLINNECLKLENSISSALYRYTPNFSGNELFINLYDKLKKAFPNASASIDETANDIADYNHETYGNTFTLVGYKAPNTQAYFNDKLLADFNTTTWQMTFEPWPGKNSYSITYRRGNGTEVNKKNFHINRRKIGDIDDDGVVDIKDLSIMSTYWGHTDPPNPMTNINAHIDNEVNILDLSHLAANFEG